MKKRKTSEKAHENEIMRERDRERLVKDFFNNQIKFIKLTLFFIGHYLPIEQELNLVTTERPFCSHWNKLPFFLNQINKV